MKNLKTIIFTACALFSLGAVASTEHTTVQGDHGKLDVVIQRPDNDAANGNGSQARRLRSSCSAMDLAAIRRENSSTAS